MISELEELEQRIAEQDKTITYLGNYTDKLVINRDKIRGLLRQYDRGELTAGLLVDYLRMYVQ